LVMGGGGVSWTICSGWSWTTFLLISASQVIRITGMSHEAPGSVLFFKDSARASCMSHKCSTTEPYHQPATYWYFKHKTLTLIIPKTIQSAQST
jgi:hypothetical protein